MDLEAPIPLFRSSAVVSQSQNLVVIIRYSPVTTQFLQCLGPSTRHVRPSPDGCHHSDQAQNDVPAGRALPQSAPIHRKCHGTEQHAVGPIGPIGDHVHAVVDAIADIHVKTPWLTEQGFVLR